MLCFPGLPPMANDDQDVGDSGEGVVPSRVKVPWAASFAMFGSLPSAIQRSIRRGSMPSNPRITTFCENLAGGADEERHAETEATDNTIAASASLLQVM